METDRKIVELALENVYPNRFQPRVKFDKDSIAELAESIKEHGVIQPIVVRPIGDKYEIIAGERRYKASVLCGKATIPSIITNLDDRESAEVALIENVQRQDLTPIEEAISYRKIIDMGYLTQEKLADKLGKTQPTVANKLRLLNLDEAVQEALLDEKISERHARSLLKIKNKEAQVAMLRKIINERLTVRKTDEEIDKMENFEIIDIGEYNDITAKEVTPPTIDKYEPTTSVIESIITEPVLEPTHYETIPEIIEPELAIKEAYPTEDGPIDVDLPQNSFEPYNKEENSGPQIVEPMENGPIEVDIPELNNSFNFSEVIQETPKFVSITNDSQPIEDVNSSIEIEAPGFMDINKIENEATNINNDKPLAPMENLLQPNKAIFPQQEQQPEEEEENIPTIPLGRFFNILEPEEEKEPQIELASTFKQFDQNFIGNKTQEPVIETSTDAFNFEFDNPTTKPNSKIEEVKSVINNIVKDLEEKGYKISTEDYDFSDSYNINIKIEKE